MADAVLTDDGNGAFEATSDHAGLAHDSIAFISDPMDVSNATERRDGYPRLRRTALAQMRN